MSKLTIKDGIKLAAGQFLFKLGMTAVVLLVIFVLLLMTK